MVSEQLSQGRRIRQGNGRFQELPYDFTEALFLPANLEFFPVTSDRLLTQRSKKRRKSLAKIRKFLGGNTASILLPSSNDSSFFPSGYPDFSGKIPPVPAVSCVLNRPPESQSYHPKIHATDDEN